MDEICMHEINWAEPFDKPLSGAAKGVLATMMCLPESDYLTAEELYSRFKADPPMVIDDALAELMSEDKQFLICVNGRYAVNKMKLVEINTI